MSIYRFSSADVHRRENGYAELNKDSKFKDSEKMPITRAEEFMIIEKYLGQKSRMTIIIEIVINYFVLLADYYDKALKKSGGGAQV